MLLKCDSLDISKFFPHICHFVGINRFSRHIERNRVIKILPPERRRRCCLADDGCQTDATSESSISDGSNGRRDGNGGHAMAAKKSKMFNLFDGRRDSDGG